MLLTNSYPSMKNETFLGRKSNFRYQLHPHDIQTLYRKFGRAKGIDITKEPQTNLHEWLNETSPLFRPELKNAIFQYSPRLSSDRRSRLKISISTKAMDEAAWEHGHGKQIIMDGTFGVVSCRMLLFIVMGVDEQRKGIPFAFFLFSAPAGAQATHSGYDREILREVLQCWKTHLGQRNGQSFLPRVAITDCDIRERQAILDVWPSIWLILCKFHVRQCWTNKRKAVVKGAGFWRLHVLQRLQILEQRSDSIIAQLDKLQCSPPTTGIRLIDSSEYEIAIQTVNSAREEFLENTKQNSDPDFAAAALGALKHIEYLGSFWMSRDLWGSWSAKGRRFASLLLDIPEESVIPTTNHLEAFNFVLKHKYIGEFTHNGHRLRFDIFISLLITQILPEIFAKSLIRTRYSLWLSQRFKDASGGADLSIKSNSAKGLIQGTAGLLWWPVDNRRQKEAEDMSKIPRMAIFQIDGPSCLRGVCASTSANTSDPNHLQYTLILCKNGYGSCECPDFQFRGGACKHLRLFRIFVEKDSSLPRFHYPLSVSEAQKISIPPSVRTPSSLTTVEAFCTLSSFQDSSESQHRPGQDEHDDEGRRVRRRDIAGGINNGDENASGNWEVGGLEDEEDVSDNSDFGDPANSQLHRFESGMVRHILVG